MICGGGSYFYYIGSGAALAGADGWKVTKDELRETVIVMALIPEPAVKPRTRTKTKTKTTPERPPLYKVILLNDDYTPREFVVVVLKAVFRIGEETAHRIMLTAHQRGACVIAVFTRDVAETKAKEATEMGRAKGYPLFFTTEKEA